MDTRFDDKGPELESVGVDQDVAHINSPALRKHIAEAIRMLLAKYFE